MNREFEKVGAKIDENLDKAATSLQKTVTNTDNEDRGPLEKAGARLDKGLNKAEDKAKELFEKAKSATKEGVQKIKHSLSSEDRPKSTIEETKTRTEKREI